MKSQTNTFVRVRAKELRRDPTDCERLLWRRLKSDQLGFSFRRQHPFGDFIVDFVCLRHKLVIEVDGSQHLDAAKRDQQRTDTLSGAGFRVLRFWNHEVIEQMDAVLEEIHRVLSAQATMSVVTHPLPNPPLEGEGAEGFPGSVLEGEGLKDPPALSEVRAS